MRLWHKIQYGLLVGFCKAIGMLPYRVLYYGMVDVIYFFIYTLGRYRTSVVRDNLRRSFPDRSPEELKTVERKFYKHLSEIFVDTVTMCSISRKEIEQRFRFVNFREQEQRMEGKTWICAMAHYGSWEYTTNYKLFTDHDVAAVYRPLHNKAFDQFYHYARSRFGTRPVPMNDIAKEIIRAEKERKKPLAVALIADQTPPFHEIHHWFRFLNQPTPFFMGTEKLARKFRLPVYFLHIRKIKRGYYQAEFIEIYNGTDSVEPYEITNRYAARLEEMIRESPELWLWSHKRWKHKPPANAGLDKSCSSKPNA